MSSKQKVIKMEKAGRHISILHNDAFVLIPRSPVGNGDKVVLVSREIGNSC